LNFAEKKPEPRGAPAVQLVVCPDKNLVCDDRENLFGITILATTDFVESHAAHDLRDRICDQTTINQIRSYA